MKFVSIGDFCVDTYPDKKILGGTAYNSAIVAKKYGAEVSVISAIGSDTSGKGYRETLQKKQINSSHLQVTNDITSTVDIALDKSNSPIFGEWQLGALQNWFLKEEDLEFIKKHDVAKMICLKPFEKQFRDFCETTLPNTLKAGDFDGNSQYSYNPKEIIGYVDGLDIIIKSINVKDKDTISFMQKLSQDKKKIVLLTLGEKGSICFANNKVYKQEAIKIKTTNTTGFGDTFIAIFLVRYFETKNIQQTMLEATQAIADFYQN